MDEQAAIAETLAGNKEAYGFLVRTYHRSLYYYVVGKVPAEAEAEDIVQRAFVTAYNKLSDYDVRQPFAAWLRGIALNHCRDLWKHHQRQAALKDRLIEVKRAEFNLQFLNEPEVDQDRVTALRTCMESLSPSEQRVVQLRFVEELPLDEIGETLNKNSEAVRQFLFRIRVRLGACIRRRLSLAEAPQ